MFEELFWACVVIVCSLIGVGLLLGLTSRILHRIFWYFIGANFTSHFSHKQIITYYLYCLIPPVGWFGLPAVSILGWLEGERTEVKENLGEGRNSTGTLE